MPRGRGGRGGHGGRGGRGVRRGRGGLRVSNEQIEAARKTKVAELRKLVMGGSVPAVKAVLLGHEDELRIHDPGKGLPLLHVAVRGGHVPMVRFLIHDCGCKLNEVYAATGWSPLHTAAYYDSAEAAEYLLGDLGVSPSTCTKNDQTALHLAAMQNSAGVAKVLVSLGADMEAIDADGKTPLQLARNRRNQGVVDVLSNADDIPARKRRAVPAAAAAASSSKAAPKSEAAAPAARVATKKRGSSGDGGGGGPAPKRRRGGPSLAASSAVLVESSEEEEEEEEEDSWSSSDGDDETLAARRRRLPSRACRARAVAKVEAAVAEDEEDSDSDSGMDTPLAAVSAAAAQAASSRPAQRMTPRKAVGPRRRRSYSDALQGLKAEDDDADYVDGDDDDDDDDDDDEQDDRGEWVVSGPGFPALSPKREAPPSQSESGLSPPCSPLSPGVSEPPPPAAPLRSASAARALLEPPSGNRWFLAELQPEVGGRDAECFICDMPLMGRLGTLRKHMQSHIAVADDEFSRLRHLKPLWKANLERQLVEQARVRTGIEAWALAVEGGGE